MKQPNILPMNAKELKAVIGGSEFAERLLQAANQTWGTDSETGFYVMRDVYQNKPIFGDVVGFDFKRSYELHPTEGVDNVLCRSVDELVSKKDLIKYYDFTYGLLKDGGVKTKIIKKYLPLINQQVNRYLQMMDFYINFTLDEEFNETVQSPIHEDFSYSSFSEGEKQRIDLALLDRKSTRLNSSHRT